MGDPEILILDEPFANLDPTTQIRLKTLLKDLKENRFWMRSMQSLYNNEDKLERITLDHFEKYINGLDSDAVKEMANQVFNPERRIEVVMQPEEEQQVDN